MFLSLWVLTCFSQQMQLDWLFLLLLKKSSVAQYQIFIHWIWAPVLVSLLTRSFSGLLGWTTLIVTKFLIYSLRELRIKLRALNDVWLKSLTEIIELLLPRRRRERRIFLDNLLKDLIQFRIELQVHNSLIRRGSLHRLLDFGLFLGFELAYEVSQVLWAPNAPVSANGWCSIFYLDFILKSLIVPAL